MVAHNIYLRKESRGRTDMLVPSQEKPISVEYPEGALNEEEDR
jgi:hypothetical protein